MNCKCCSPPPSPLSGDLIFVKGVKGEGGVGCSNHCTKFRDPLLGCCFTGENALILKGYSIFLEN